MEQKRWYVAYTKPQFERRVHEQLGKWYGIESWCPLTKSKRQWSDRVKVLDVPLFRCYVFLRVTEKERVQALSLDGMLNYVRYLGKPAIIKDHEIEELKEFLEEYKAVKVQSFEPGQTVVIRSGVFEGKEGVIKTVLKDRVVMDMPQLRCRLEASLETL
ncbi:MAG TPA: UpxY family transcription antiterminator [Chitinophagaceae bacterium]|nr:UpxY family transcription antiterminator [Chitinophagaceae bacterium]